MAQSKNKKPAKNKNSSPSSEFEKEDKCPSCGAKCNIHIDLDEKDFCNECREQY